MMDTLINSNTLVPLGVCVSLVATLCTGYAWLSSRLLRIDRRLERMEDRNKTTLTRIEFENWSLKFGRDNPDITVPEAPESP